MKNKLIMYKGLPGCGKDSFCKKYMDDNPNLPIKRINKDLLREMLHFSKHSKTKERDILEVRDTLINLWLEQGFTVICTDTNLNPIHERTLRSIAEKHNVEFEINDSFLQVDVDECIRRDYKREKTVGEKVILEMYYQYVHKENFYKPPVEKLPACVLVDIDGCVAERGDRSPFDWKRVGEDIPKQNIIDLVNSFISDRSVFAIFFSGRDSVCREETLAWLHDYIDRVDFLFMRKENDNRSDVDVKRELFYNHIHGKFNPVLAIDDRRRIVDLYRREIGLTCLEVADHRF